MHIFPWDNMIPQAPHHCSRHAHLSEEGDFSSKRKHSFLFQAAEIWGAITAGVIAAGAAAYSANQQKKSAAAANAAIAGAQPVAPGHVPFPTLVNTGQAQGKAVQTNLNGLGGIFDLARRVNGFQVGQAKRGYTAMQPYFQTLQEQIGRNALSFAKGELPSDVVSSIGRAAATRGLASGFGLGASGAGVGTSLGSLNLRALGLTSLDLSQKGTSLGMAVNAQAQALTPALFDPSSMFLTPNTQLAADQFNAGAINQTNQLNAGYQNAANVQNVGLQNAILQQQATNTLAASNAANQQYSAAANTIAGLAATQFNTGQNNAGFYNSAYGANKQIGDYGGTVTSSPYGYAIRPQTVS